MNKDPNPPATETTPGPCPCVECRAARAAADMFRTVHQSGPPADPGAAYAADDPRARGDAADALASALNQWDYPHGRVRELEAARQRAVAERDEARKALAEAVAARDARVVAHADARKELADTAEALSSAGDLIGELTALVASLRA